MKVQNWLAKGLLLCLDQLRRFVLVLCAEARLLSGRRVFRIEDLATPEEDKALIHAVFHS